MDEYKKLARELIEEHIADRIDTQTHKEILEALQEDTEDVFGNLTGSRTCNTKSAQAFINSSNAVFDEEIIDLYSDMGDDYMSKTLTRGAETFDVVTLELVAPQVIYEMLEATA